MSTFEIFLFFVATPVLLVVAVGMVIIAAKAKRIEDNSSIQLEKTETLEKSTKEHIHEESKRHEYKEGKFIELDNKIENIPNAISNKIIAPINKIYEKIELLGINASAANLRLYLDKVIGVGKYGDLGKDMMFFGQLVEGLKITYLLRLSQNKDKLIIQTFSNFFEEITPEGMSKLLEYNSNTIIGTIGVTNFEGKKVIMIDETIDLPNNRITENSISEALSILTNIHVELFAKKEIIQLTFFEFVMDDYLKLSLGEEKYKELVENNDNNPKETNKEENN